jgi:hypothetical protein
VPTTALDDRISKFSGFQERFISVGLFEVTHSSETGELSWLGIVCGQQRHWNQMHWLVGGGDTPLMVSKQKFMTRRIKRSHKRCQANLVRQSPTNVSLLST